MPSIACACVKPELRSSAASAWVLVEQLTGIERVVGRRTQALEQPRLEPNADGGGNIARYLVLKLEHVVKAAVVALGPNLAALVRIDEREREPHLLARSADAAL